jgi:hypothetical protein
VLSIKITKMQIKIEIFVYSSCEDRSAAHTDIIQFSRFHSLKRFIQAGVPAEQLRT